MRIAIMGSGGVGGYFGARLAQAGQDVTFIARGEHLRAMLEQGLQVTSPNGDFKVPHVQATGSPALLGQMDAVIIAVKAWQISEAAHAIRPMLGPETCVLPLENGVEAPDQLAAVLETEPVLGGLCQIISMVAGPGHIRHAGFEPLVMMGELNNKPSPRVAGLRQAFESAGVKAIIPPDIHVAMWRKFLLIASFAGVGAVTRAPIGPLRSLPQTRQMLREAMREILEVAGARGIALPDDAIGDTMATLDGLPGSATASMQRDIIAGRPSELESLSGAVVRLGREYGAPTPLNAFIYDSLMPLELQARGQLQFPI
jgi:2-dehydropantoate 2-reductase